MMNRIATNVRRDFASTAAVRSAREGVNTRFCRWSTSGTIRVASDGCASMARKARLMALISATRRRAPRPSIVRPLVRAPQDR